MTHTFLLSTCNLKPKIIYKLGRVIPVQYASFRYIAFLVDDPVTSITTGQLANSIGNLISNCLFDAKSVGDGTTVMGEGDLRR